MVWGAGSWEAGSWGAGKLGDVEMEAGELGSWGAGPYYTVTLIGRAPPRATPDEPPSAAAMLFDFI